MSRPPKFTVGMLLALPEGLSIKQQMAALGCSVNVVQNLRREARELREYRAEPRAAERPLDPSLVEFAEAILMDPIYAIEMIRAGRIEAGAPDE